MNFLVDVNLPKYFAWFHHPNFLFVSDINSRLTDTDIWMHALQNNYVILTRDTDFYHRVMASIKHPKIVYFDLGNVTLKQLHLYFQIHWKQIEEHLILYNFIIAKPSFLQIVK